MRIGDVDQFRADLLSIAEGGTVVDPEVIDVMLVRANRTNPDVEQLADPSIRGPRPRRPRPQQRRDRCDAAVHFRAGRDPARVKPLYDALMLPNDTADHRRVLAVLRYRS